MATKLYTELSDWSQSLKQLALTDEIILKLGSFAEEAKAASAIVDVFLFTYDVNGNAVMGFIVVPKMIKEELPVIVYNRGGTGDYGLIKPGQYFTKIARIAKWGYAVIGSYYPGNSYSEGKDERGGELDLESVSRLYELIKHISYLDENKIGMLGESRGGMMTYLCMQDQKWIKAALTIGGPTNLDRSLEFRPELGEVYSECFDNTQENRDKRSVVRWVEKLQKNIPIRILHGGADDKVSPLDALELAQKLETVSYPYDLHIIEGGDHGLFNKALERDKLIKDWFDQHLG